LVKVSYPAFLCFNVSDRSTQPDHGFERIVTSVIDGSTAGGNDSDVIVVVVVPFPQFVVVIQFGCASNKRADRGDLADRQASGQWDLDLASSP